MKHPNRGFNTRQMNHKQSYKQPVVRDRQYRQTHKTDTVDFSALERIMWRIMFLRYL